MGILQHDVGLHLDIYNCLYRFVFNFYNFDIYIIMSFTYTIIYHLVI